MRLAVSKKALLGLGGLTSSSAGGWQIYEKPGALGEEKGPTIDQLLKKEGFSYNPIKSDDLKAEGVLDVSGGSSTAKFNFIQGPSVKRLLPSLDTVTDEDASTGTNVTFALDQNFYSGFEAGGASFTADIKHWAPETSKKNGGLIMKLELVVKNKSGDKGLVIQNIISNLVDQKPFVDHYRFFIVQKKPSETWKTTYVFSGKDSWIFPTNATTNKYHFSLSSAFNLEIDTENYCSRETPGNCPNDFKTKTAANYRYSAVWEPSSSGSQSLFEPIKVVAKETGQDKASSVWGRRTADSTFRFEYVYKDSKWTDLSYTNSTQQLTVDGVTTTINSSDSTTEKVINDLLQKNKNGKWTTLDDFCKSWSNERKPENKERWKDYCFKKP